MIMKRVSFAWITEVIDFDSRSEAIKFVENNLDKGWLFHDYNPDKYINKPYSFDADYQIKMEEYLSKFIAHTQSNGTTYSFGNKDVREFWTVEVQKPYGKYNSGW